MLKMEFDPSDRPEEYRTHYAHVTLSWEDCAENDIDQMLQHFEDFLKAMGYAVDTGDLQYLPEVHDADL